MLYTERNKQAIGQVNVRMMSALKRDYYDSGKEQFNMTGLIAFLSALTELRGDSLAMLADGLSSTHL